MRKVLCDMFVKQPGSYDRLLKIARMTYPDMTPIKTETFTFENSPVLVLTFETNKDVSDKIEQ